VTPDLFLADLQRRGVSLTVEGNNLRCRAPKAVLTPEVRAGLVEHKAAIIKILSTPKIALSGAPSGPDKPAPRFGSDKWQARYNLVATPEQFQTFLRQLGRQPRVAIDLETTSLDHTEAEIVGYAFCWRPGEAWYLPVMAPEGEARLDPDATLAALRPILQDPGVAKVNQNIKFDTLVLRRHDVRVAGIAGDSMLVDYLLRAGELGHNLDEMALRHLNYETIPITDLIGPKGKAQKRMDQVATAQVAEYAGEDADVAYRLVTLLEGRLQDKGLDRLYHDVEVPLVEVLAEMEYTGIRIDVPLLQGLGAEMAQELRELEKKIHTQAGKQFNINSHPQLRKVLFDELKMPIQGKSPSGEASTDAEALTKLAEHGHPLPARVLEYRSLATLRGTYVDALATLVRPVTGRIHTSFNQAVTATGRLSSSAPNLQNIPSRSHRGQEIRKAFLPADGWLLLKADYSQIELRMLAYFCGDDELCRAFAEGRDIHALVASQVNHVPEEQVTREMRAAAKTVNFGVIYGMTARGLAGKIKVNEAEAAQFIDGYYARYPKVADYQDRLLEDCRRRGYVSTILGRCRHIQGIRPGSTYKSRNGPEREAINMQIQGSAADLLKVAMVNIHRRLRREGRRARMLLTVHDELVFEVPPDELNAVAQLVREEMEESIPLKVPVTADLAAGPNWLAVEKL
jgi:DNA polymerase-1